MFYQDITKMSTGSLKAQHQAIQDRLSQEDSLPPGQEKIYGVRQFPDWRQQADEIESELTSRNETYAKIQW